MVYTARLVIIGKTGGDPFAGFLLASNSLPYRRMEIKDNMNGEKRIYVFPREGYEENNINYPDVDNYACVIGSEIPKIERIPQNIIGSGLERVIKEMKKYVIVSFNGHMCKRCLENIKDGMKPQIALDSTLFEFRGVPMDARIGGVIYVDEDFSIGVLGVNDKDKSEKRVKSYKLEENKGKYIYVKDASIDRTVDIPHDVSAEELARYISKKMILEAEKVLASGVCILRGKVFEAGVYNTPVKEIDEWAKK